MTENKKYSVKAGGVRAWMIPGVLAPVLMVLGLLALLLFVARVEAAEHRSVFLWFDPNPQGAIDLFRLRVSTTPGGAPRQDIEVDASAARAYEIPPPHAQGRNCGTEAGIQGEGVKTYYIRVRAEASGGVSDWSPEVVHTWNFLEAPSERIIIDMDGPTAELKVFRRLANGKRKRIFHYDGG